MMHLVVAEAIELEHSPWKAVIEPDRGNKPWRAKYNQILLVVTVTVTYG